MEIENNPVLFDDYAEASVLSAIMCDDSIVNEAMAQLSPDLFYKIEHITIFKALQSLFNNEVGLDLITVDNYLRNNKLYSKAGGEEYLSNIYSIVISGAHIKHHIEILKEKYALRKVYKLSQYLSEGSSTGDSITELLTTAENVICDITSSLNREGFRKLSDKIPDLLENMEQMLTTGTPKVKPVDTGLVDVDKIVGGFYPGQLVIIAGRPGHGKSTIAANIAMHIVEHLNKPVGIFSLEMTIEEILVRVVSAKSHVPAKTIIDGYGLNKDDRKSIIDACEELYGKDILVDDSGEQTPITIKAKSKRLKSLYPELGAIIVDYTQLMKSGQRSENRTQEVSEISRKLKVLAKELEAPVIALSQLNRANEKRPNKRPQLSDLRESGAIEQDADLVMFVHQESKYQKTDENEGVAEIVIGKHRNGPTGIVNVMIDPQTLVFKNLMMRELDQIKVMEEREDYQ